MFIKDKIQTKEQIDKDIDEFMKFVNSPEEVAKRAQQYIDNLPLVIEYIRVNPKKCNVQHLQRKFQIPYVVSARIMNTMEKDGMIGPWTGNINREVFLR